MLISRLSGLLAAGGLALTACNPPAAALPPPTLAAATPAPSPPAASPTPAAPPTPLIPPSLEPAGCRGPPDDYTRLKVNGQQLNARTLAMLQYAAELYDGPIAVADTALTQG